MRTATSLRSTNKIIDLAEFQNRAFFNVSEVPAAYLHKDNELDEGLWVKSPDKKAIVRSDTGDYISTVGRNYSIVQNQNFFENVVSKLQDGNIDFVPKAVHVDSLGKRTTMVVSLPQFQMFKGTPEEQDFELRVGNSFDTTWAASTMLGWLRLICTNGMMSFNTDFSFRMTHKGDINKKAASAIDLYKNFEQVWMSDKDNIDRMANTNGKKDSVARYIGNGKVSQSTIFKGERWAAKLLNKWVEEGEPTNYWNLYNLNTNLISHSYGHAYSSKLTAMDALNKELKLWPRLLEAA